MAWLTGWTHREKLTVQHANVDGALTNFPVLVKLTADADYSDALATGHDIRFTQSDGETLLKYQRQAWSGGGGGAVTAIFWVKLPSISAVAGTDFYVYWQKAGASDGEDAANVWTNGFEAVWHLNSLLDSTGNGYTLTAYNGASGSAGKIGGCYSFTAGSNQYLQRNAAPVTAYPWTLSAWVKPNDLANWYGALWVGDKDVATYWVSIGPDGSVAGDPARLYLHKHSTGAQDTIVTTTGLSAATWHHIVGVGTNATNRHVILDGGGKQATATNIPISNWDRVAIGGHRDSTPGRYFDGLIDECRLSSAIRADAWNKFEHRNINEADNELTRGGKETRPGGRKAGIIGGGIAA